MKKKKTFGIGLGSVVLLTKAFTPSAMAACSNTAPPSNTTVTCTGSGIAAVIAQTGSTGVTINADSTASGSFVRSANPVIFSVDTNSTINSSGNFTLTGGGGTGTVRGAVLLGVGNGNQITNASGAVITTTGAFNDGMAANGSGNTLTNRGSITTSGPNAYGMTAAWGQTNVGQLNNTLINSGSVTTSGSNARAASILGGSGTINNSGTLTTTGSASPTAYLQGNNDQLINSGTISASGSGSDAVFSNTAGSSFVATIQNLAGGSIISQNGSGIRTLNGNSTIINAGLVQSGIGTAITMGNGNDSLILQTGSVINGAADGGAGSNTVTLQGSGTASNAFTNFQTLLMQGTLWNWTGSGTFTLAHVQTGTLNLTGTLGASATALVDSGATLQATAQNLPSTVTDDGLVRFAQDSAGTYTGSISGTGAVDKTGAGVLTLAPAAASGNTYSGGTTIDQGTIAVGADNALGANTGGLTFNSGTLQLTTSFDLAATRAITLAAGGGTIDTQSFDSTLSQAVSGTGALTKAGSGSLLMTGVSTYSGATTVAAGTLAIGDATHASAALTGGGAITVAAGATLGGYGSVTGAVTNNGTLAVANAVPSFASEGNGAFSINGSLVNAGLVQIGGPAAGGVGNRLNVAGNYTGQDGTIGLNTVVAGDGAASDRLVLSGGTATGSTHLQVTNVGGQGAQTVADGIQVIQATNGATTASSAFTLAAPVKAGAYSYYLAKGGVSSGTTDNWYLRNTVAPLPTATVPGQPPVTTPGAPGEPPVVASGVPIAAEGTPPLPPAPPAGSAAIPLYRVEVPVYAAAPGVARELGLMQIDTFHDRQGDQALLSESGKLPAAWGRVWGGHSVLSQNGTASPQFDGSVYGIQAGQDLYADRSASGQRNHYGLFVGFARATGDVDGFALGMPNLAVGHLAINAYSLGGYWTHIGPSGWYTDAVLMGSSLTVDPDSRDGLNTTTHGNAVTGSLEGGLPIPLGAGLTLEPQAQLVWQHLSLSDFNDGVSSVGFNSGNTFVGRIGARLQAQFDAFAIAWRPYLRVSFLREFGSDDKVTFGGGTVIPGTVGQTAAQLGAGVVGKFSTSGSVFATLGWVTNLGGAHQRTVTGDAGVRWVW
ncbi:MULTISPECIES: autotransporter family protein [Paraburkholderia]|uniref:autotransporter family protein n=1 Tax=Paraburkholderia TaxID=1822464 RepID=UPI00225142EA|nr:MULTISPECIES: autotransporter outer membrane beta-barrel domain-containing protein [Paraburkholderia]MCX4139799.1 autotransporter outer membrane beta-barrel domain-containing protein [Paraburkholderia aspalathi]MCX4154761.1 autotransporter outer membrane beta-barrel domain-containing protein [Paraburkholderia aspalathi]MDN7164173.1 autotransporter outer membrane beta-barrel domain-containing protein [Paraburkholderia sp. SECH2]MDN7172486.1 autotransporter outer membrane beta-barrel domain-co